MTRPGVSDLMPSRFLAASLTSDFHPVSVILSPPRCGSTALARSLWQHQAFRWYLHEPCDWAYHVGLAPQHPVINTLIDRAQHSCARPAGNGVVVKEMTFQAGDAIAEFEVATVPVIFLIRDPRQAVHSRMCQRARDGDNPAFPAREAGWEALLSAIAHFSDVGMPYVVVDVGDIRRNPESALRILCRSLGLPWDASMLRWESLPDLRLGNLGSQDAWYTRVLRSTGWQPPDAEIPPPEVFRQNGMSSVVAESISAYQQARNDPQFISF